MLKKIGSLSMILVGWGCANADRSGDGDMLNLRVEQMKGDQAGARLAWSAPHDFEPAGYVVERLSSLNHRDAELDSELWRRISGLTLLQRNNFEDSEAPEAGEAFYYRVTAQSADAQQVSTESGAVSASQIGVVLNYRLSSAGSLECMGGSLEGFACASDSECGHEGSCLPSFTGTNSICLPYRWSSHSPATATVVDLYDTINADSSAEIGVNSISKLQWDQPFPAGDTLYSHMGRRPDGRAIRNFELEAGVGYRVSMNTETAVTIAGSYDADSCILLRGAGTENSFTGTADYCAPYHILANTAADLYAEIVNQAGFTAVNSISKLREDADHLQSYIGAITIGGEVRHPGNFRLQPGESYRISMNSTVLYCPSTF